MLAQFVIGSAMILLTTLCHGIFVVLGMTAVGSRYPKIPNERSKWTDSLVVAGFALWLFLASVAEIWLWAAIIGYLSNFQTFEEALYFSTASFTTLGYGDVLLEREWRLLGSFAAANGLLLFGWSTAQMFVVVQLVYHPPTLHP